VKILVYDDRSDFGGHQIMACLGIEALIQDPELDIVAMTNPRNTRLSNRLSDIRGLKVFDCPIIYSTYTTAVHRFNNRFADKLRQVFRDQNPDVVLCIQGDIEHASLAVATAKGLGIKCISYIALPHSKYEMGAKLGRLRDLFNRSLLNRPDAYIAISKSMKQRLIKRGVSKPITIVQNGVRAPQRPSRTPNLEKPVIGLLGRIEFKQKRQDFMVDTFCNHPNVFRSFRMKIMGDGPDSVRLSKLISTSQRAKDITLEAWNSNTDAFYEQIDILVIPSHFEGVPLVMLEALIRGIPVLGSACDGMQDILPPHWQFKKDDASSLVEAVSRLMQSSGQDVRVITDRVRTDMTVENFQINFRKAVLQA
jgi:glycosyltransferase involved in cell wall biosynthesis